MWTLHQCSFWQDVDYLKPPFLCADVWLILEAGLCPVVTRVPYISNAFRHYSILALSYVNFWDVVLLPRQMFLHLWIFTILVCALVLGLIFTSQILYLFCSHTHFVLTNLGTPVNIVYMLTILLSFVIFLHFLFWYYYYNHYYGLI